MASGLVEPQTRTKSEEKGGWVGKNRKTKLRPEDCVKIFLTKVRQHQLHTLSRLL
jgi:hypothetical protein